MSRAVVHFAWGREHAAELCNNLAVSVQTPEPRVIVADREAAALLGEECFCKHIIIADLQSAALTNKAQLFNLLPEEYDSFLFLDTDAYLLSDVSFGFDKAERYGIAVAMAPHYSLDAFWGFHKVMESVDVIRASQLQYNTGVIFFTRRPDVEKVFIRWAELAGSQDGRGHSDQPYFTLAMELVGFNPYTLSPAYNYRAFGEYASGMIRVWHSRAPIPADVNVGVHVWPGRRFVGSQRIRTISC